MAEKIDIARVARHMVMVALHLNRKTGVRLLDQFSIPEKDMPKVEKGQLMIAFSGEPNRLQQVDDYFTERYREHGLPHHNLTQQRILSDGTQALFVDVSALAKNTDVLAAIVGVEEKRRSIKKIIAGTAMVSGGMALEWDALINRFGNQHMMESTAGILLISTGMHQIQHKLWEPKNELRTKKPGDYMFFASVLDGLSQFYCENNIEYRPPGMVR